MGEEIEMEVGMGMEMEMEIQKGMGIEMEMGRTTLLNDKVWRVPGSTRGNHTPWHTRASISKYCSALFNELLPNDLYTKNICNNIFYPSMVY